MPANGDSLAAELRRFNRFYTPLLGMLEKGYLDTPHSVQEARVLYEVATRPGCTAKEIRAATGFDQGYLSRILARLERQDLLTKRPDPTDRRAQHIHLTPTGEAAYATLNARADAQAHRLLQDLTPPAQERLRTAFTTIERLLTPTPTPPWIRVREERIGDLGWSFHRQAVLYAAEHDFSAVFETYVAAGLHPYLAHKDNARDRLWVAEMDDVPVGCIAVHHDDARPRWAKLRWFLVEGEARGQGIGSRLLQTAIDFSRAARYAGIFLWTVDTLHAARSLYERAGFRLVEEDPDPCPWAEWAHEQKWELRLNR